MFVDYAQRVYGTYLTKKPGLDRSKSEKHVIPQSIGSSGSLIRTAHTLGAML